MAPLLTQATIDVDELRELLETGAPVTILDVRKSEERAEWAIPGSVHVDAYEALQAGDASVLDRVDLPWDIPVVTVCGAGKTSLAAMEHLRARGYDARSLSGGMKAWSLAWNSAVVPLPGSAATVIQIRRTVPLPPFHSASVICCPALTGMLGSPLRPAFTLPAAARIP